MAHSAGGLVAGTRLLCCDGNLPVEFIDVGERIITRDTGVSIVTGINRKILETHFIRFRPNALGADSPISELLVPHDQLIFLRNWRARDMFKADQALVKARDLVDDVFVEMTEKRREVVFQISFSSPHILYVESAELGSANARLTHSKALHPT